MVLMFYIEMIVFCGMLVKREIFVCLLLGIGWLVWYSSVVGCMLILCSFCIECWVGLVFSLLVLVMNGISVRCVNVIWLWFRCRFIWCVVFRNGSDLILFIVLLIFMIVILVLLLCEVVVLCLMNVWILLVICGMICIVLLRYLLWCFLWIMDL